MNAHTRFALTIASLAIAIPQTAAIAKAPDAKAWSGTWTLNSAKSKFSLPDSTTKSDTRTYTVRGSRFTMRSTAVNASGKTMNWGYSARADGRWYPTSGNPNTDHIALTLVGPREVKSQTRLHGKLSAKSTGTVSGDGKELTIHRQIMTVKGGPSDDTLVFDRTK
jgi:hypothetical protein